jgi:hypothetical protein
MQQQQNRCLKVVARVLARLTSIQRSSTTKAKPRESALMLNLTRRRLFKRAVPTDTNPAHLADSWKKEVHSRCARVYVQRSH